MRLDRYTYRLIVVALLFLTSCGQVGTITGGAVDERAPIPIADEIEPPMASTNTYPDEIIIPFNEYIALNKPTQNISVIPNDVTLDHTIKKKSLVLSVKEGEWKENTTYSIYLNRAVKDITEANDSIMQYVFSTGGFIDSLKGGVTVLNAYNQSLMEGVTVGLFQQELHTDESELSPRYFTATDKNGIASFNYLRDDNYYLYAFKDENQNNTMDKNEWRGKMSNLFVPGVHDSVTDTIFLMPPQPGPLSVVSNEFISPGIWCVGFNKRVPDTISFDALEGTNIIAEEWNEQRDSITFFLKNELSGNASFSFENPATKTKDTINKRFFFKEPPILQAKHNLDQNVLTYGDTLLLSWNDPILSMLPNKIQGFYYENDSTKKDMSFDLSLVSPNKLKVISEVDQGLKIELNFPPDAIQGENLSLKDTLNISYTRGKSKDVGSIIFNLEKTLDNGVLILMNRKGEEVLRKPIDNRNPVIIEHLKPGNYRYAILFDENQNDIWDSGNIFTNLPPENIIWFKKPVTVRGNWEIETEVEWRTPLK